MQITIGIVHIIESYNCYLTSQRDKTDKVNNG